MFENETNNCAEIMKLLILISIWIGIQAALDVNPIHQLCQPCIAAINSAKMVNKIPAIKHIEINTCSAVIRNTHVCKGSIDVTGMLLKSMPAKVICGIAQMCKRGGKKKRSTSSKSKSLSSKVVTEFQKDPTDDEFALYSRRMRRNASSTSTHQLEQFPAEFCGNLDKFQPIIDDLSKRFRNALSVYMKEGNLH